MGHSGLIFHGKQKEKLEEMSADQVCSTTIRLQEDLLEVGIMCVRLLWFSLNKHQGSNHSESLYMYFKVVIL